MKQKSDHKKSKYTAGKTIFMFLFFTCCALGQQEPQYTQYMYNTVNFNPAYAGSRDVLSLFGLHRTQWVGLDGAPVTNAVSIHSPIGNNVGLGFSFVNDKIGPMDENLISGDFSYTLNAGDNYKLAFGVRGTMDLLSIDFTKLNIYDPLDPRFQNNIYNQLSPNVGAGLYMYSDKTYFGLSIPTFLQTNHYEHNSNSVAQSKMHYYIMAGHVMNLSYNLRFKPSLLLKAVEGSPLQADISANFLFNEIFTVGIAYRWDASLSGLLGFQITDSLFIGYTYDAETTKLADYNSGSHEVFLRFELFKKYDKVMNPRFF